MQAQNYNYDDAPAQRVITDVIAKLRSLTDNDNDPNKPSFNTVLPLTESSYADILEQSAPAAFVYFGEEAEGYNSSNQFDEMYLFTPLKILFMSYIPNNNDGTYPDIQRYMMQIHRKVLQNLRVPTDDLTTGIPFQKNSAGQEIWEFRTAEGGGENLWKSVHHRFDVNSKWIDEGRSIKSQYYLHSLEIVVQVNNFVPQT